MTLEQEKYRQIAELHVAHRHGLLQANGETEDMRDTINLVVDKIEKQARRSRKKFMDKRRRADRASGAAPVAGRRSRARQPRRRRRRGSSRAAR